MPSDIEEVAVVEARASLEEEKLVCDVVGNEKVKVGEKTQGTTVVIKPCSRKKKQKIDDDGNVKDDKEKLVCDVVGNEKVQVGEKTQGTTKEKTDDGNVAAAKKRIVQGMPCDIEEVAASLEEKLACDTVCNEQVEMGKKTKEKTDDDDGNIVKDDTPAPPSSNKRKYEEDEDSSSEPKKAAPVAVAADKDQGTAIDPYQHIRTYDGKMHSNCKMIEGTGKMVHSHFWYTKRKHKKRPCDIAKVAGSYGVGKEQVDVGEKTQGTTSVIKPCMQNKVKTEKEKIKKNRKSKKKIRNFLPVDKHEVNPELFSKDPYEQEEAMMKQCRGCYSVRHSDPWGLKSKKREMIYWLKY